MNVSTLNSGFALSRVQPDDAGGAGTTAPVGIIATSAPLRFVPDIGPAVSGLRATTGNRIPPPEQGSRIEQPRGLAADRMDQLQADIPQDGAMSALLAMLIKFSEAQGTAR